MKHEFSKKQKIIVVFILFGVMWGLFFCPRFMDKPQSLTGIFMQWLENWTSTSLSSYGGLTSIIMGLFGLCLLAAIGILWVILWIIGLVKIQYILFGMFYIGLYGLFFVFTFTLFLKYFNLHEILDDF